MNNRIHYAMPNAEYHARPELNNSAIKRLLRSAAHYQSYLTEKREPTTSMIIGSAVHAAVLEPDVFSREYVAIPEGLDKRTKDGKATFAEIEASGKTPFKFADYQNCLAIAEAVRNHAAVKKLLEKGDAEVSIFGYLDDVPVKCRPDWLSVEKGLIVDIKTTDNASESGFTRSIATYGYDIQAALYLDVCNAAGIDCDTFIFIAVENVAPYAVGIYELDLASLEVGRSKYQSALALWKHCTATDEWPGYPEEIITLQLPAWAMR